MMNLLTLREAIKTEAHRLGFNHVGVATALPGLHKETYLHWIQTGRHANMDYLSRDDAIAKRLDPGLILKGCQRIICLAFPYHPPQAGLGDVPPGKGRISAYAITRDYHNIIWDKLSLLESFIHAQAGKNIRLKSYVDTGPILERAYASLSGIGIAGKNSCLIIQGSGSYFFLAEILTDIALPADNPYTRDLCGSCQRCIDACPTACILPDRTIDSARCISYLTIENKGTIPDKLKEQLGAWVFGCDVCQIVCPHNATTPDQAISLGKPLFPEFIDLIRLVTEDDAGFSEKYGKTPLARSKRHGLLRNAAVVLGNQGLKEALPALKQALNHENDPGVVDACRWAIKAINKVEK